MTNNQVIGDFAAAILTSDGSVTVQENERSKHINEVRWRDQILNNNAKYKAKPTKAAGRSVDEARELLSPNLQDGQLPHHILSAIEKL